MGTPPKKPFVDRAARFDLRLPVRFFTSDGLVYGESINISDSGVSVRFDRYVDIWMLGELTFITGVLLPTLLAKVARLNNGEAGLSFRKRSEEDQETIDKLIAMARLQAQPDRVI